MAAQMTVPSGVVPAGSVDLSTDLGGMVLPNPVMTASGCAANGKELHRFVVPHTVRLSRNAEHRLRRIRRRRCEL